MARGSSVSRFLRESALRHDSAFWRRLARFGAAEMPEWWMRYSPPFFGVAAALLVPPARRAVQSNLRRIRGEAPPWQDAREIAQTFSTYANCLSEALAYGSKNEKVPEVAIKNKHFMTEAIARGRGVVMATAHTAGWDVAGPTFGDDHHVNLVMVMERERSHEARRLHDDARKKGGLGFVHVGEDPLDALPLLGLLKQGTVVATQIDRVPPGMRAREVTLLGRPAKVPEGTLRLAEISGAPLVPMFCARLGFRSYLMEVFEPIPVPRRATEEDRQRAANALAAALGDFLRRNPTQWFHFGGE